MTIEPFKWGSADEKRLGKQDLNKEKGVVFPELDIFGAPVRRPCTTRKVPGTMKMFVVLPHRPLTPDEARELAEALKAAPQPVPAAPAEERIETPNESESEVESVPPPTGRGGKFRSG